MKHRYNQWLSRTSIIKLVLGKTYYIAFSGYGGSVYGCYHLTKLIRPTRCGYNFLKDDNTCILYNHLYVPKRLKKECIGEVVFLRVPNYIIIKEQTKND